MDFRKLIPVEGKEGWYRDPLTNAIVNNNTSEYDKYMKAFNKRQKQEVTIETLQTEVDEVKSDLKDIKGLLKTIIELQNDSN